MTGEPLQCDVVLPCPDEAAALPRVLARMPVGYPAIGADNRSRDGSPEITRQCGALPVDYRPRRGRSKVTGPPLGALRAVNSVLAR